MSPIIDNPFTWVYFPTAFMLGALHALEPGHAKTWSGPGLVDTKIRGISIGTEDKNGNKDKKTLLTGVCNRSIELS